MKPKPQPRDAFELFQAHFDQILNLDHALIQLASKIDWSRFDAAFADSYSEDMGAPVKAIRLMVGLHFLNDTTVLRERNEGVADVAARLNRKSVISKAITAWIGASWPGCKATRSTPCWPLPGPICANCSGGSFMR